jgi:hypothetical protein
MFGRRLAHKNHKAQILGRVRILVRCTDKKRDT